MMTQHCWRATFMIFQGIRTGIAKKPYTFVIFLSGGSRPPVPPLDPRKTLIITYVDVSTRARGLNIGLSLLCIFEHFVA